MYKTDAKGIMKMATTQATSLFFAAFTIMRMLKIAKAMPKATTIMNANPATSGPEFEDACATIIR